MLAGLVYRFGPSDVPAPGRIVANGQCTAVVRERLLAAGGYRHAAGHMTDDAALARGAGGATGWRVAFRDAGALLEVKMHDSAGRGVARVGALAGAARGGAARVAGRRPGGGVADDGAAGRCACWPGGRAGWTSGCSPSRWRCWSGCAGPTRAAAPRSGSRRSPIRRPPPASRSRRCARGGSGAGGPTPERRDAEQRPDQAHQRAGADHALDRVEGELDQRDRRTRRRGRPTRTRSRR